MTYNICFHKRHQLCSSFPTKKEEITAHGNLSRESEKFQVCYFLDRAGWLAGWAAHETDVPCERFDVSSYHLSSSEEGKGNQAAAAQRGRVRGGVRGGVVLADDQVNARSKLLPPQMPKLERKNAEVPSVAPNDHVGQSMSPPKHLKPSAHPVQSVDSVE